MNSEIKYIYFDIGGVVVFDFSGTNKWQEMVDDLGIPEDLQHEFWDLFKTFEADICRGGKDLKDFIKAAEEELGVTFPNEYNMLEDFANRFEPNPSIKPLLQDLSQKYKIGLLTNMYPDMFETIERKNLLPDIEWDTVIDSSKVGYKKPDQGIYQLSEKGAGVNPEEILFVENTQSNVDAAQQRGWKTVLYDPSDPQGSNERIVQLVEK